MGSAPRLKGDGDEMDSKKRKVEGKGFHGRNFTGKLEAHKL